jgi:predicted dehydrogenase/nucleoside-diphosphate-sugar epimerase
MTRSKPRVGLVGAGYIAAWHAEAIRASGEAVLSAVCDVDADAAAALAERYGVTAYDNLDALLAGRACDAVHILTPPHLHAQIALEAIASGVHVFVEKPFALHASDCREVAQAARAAGVVVGVNHNFLGLPSYERLRAALREGVIGRVDSADIVWRYPLAPLRSGPFGLWMLRAPGNLLLELGPHLFAFAVDLFGPVEDIRLDVSKPIGIPGGVTHHQAWRILARAGGVDVTLALSLVEGVDDRSVSLRGVSGAARLDFARDTLILRREGAADLVAGPFLEAAALAGAHLREGSVNALRQAISLNRRSPYALGFLGAIRAFHRAARSGAPLDPRFDVRSAEVVMAAIGDALERLPAHASTPFPRVASGRSASPSALVIGGTGFIGRALVRRLAAAGRSVRVLSRGRSAVFDDLADRVEMTAAPLSNPAALEAAMAGVETVYHLAKAEETSWEAYLRNDVAVVERVAEAALAAGGPRFVYAGTIASYDASDPSAVITERTPFDPDMAGRNLYARSKALCETRLAALRSSRGLRLVIARPGVVIGPGGPLQHWGIGRWHGAGAVRIWGDGRNILPFVLIDDVADALARLAEVEGVEGDSFNLVGEPLLSARDYFDGIHALLATRINARPSNLTALYLADLAKHVLKTTVLGRKGLSRPSLRDWRSRAHLSRFENTHAKEVLQWRPEGDRGVFLRKAIAEANLFGF